MAKLHDVRRNGDLGNADIIVSSLRRDVISAHLLSQIFQKTLVGVDGLLQDLEAYGTLVLSLSFIVLTVEVNGSFPARSRARKYVVLRFSRIVFVVRCLNASEIAAKSAE